MKSKSEYEDIPRYIHKKVVIVTIWENNRTIDNQWGKETV